MRIRYPDQAGATPAIVARWLATASLVLSAACGAEIDGIELVAGERQRTVRFDNQAICSVTVSGFGTIDVETEYIPRVVWCELGGASDEALKAQAIAARTFMYRLLQIRTGSSRYMRNSTADQVYSKVNCNARQIPQRYLDVARETAGLVMVKPNGDLHAGYYRGIYRIGCQRRSDCYGEPCMAQWGAYACANQGWNYTQILDLYYLQPEIRRATPACIQNGGNPQTTCALAAGQCQAAGASCDGRYHDGLSCGSGERCCMARQAIEYGSCSYGGMSGTCLDQNESSCSGSFQSGLCPGSTSVRCCLPSQPDLNHGSCNYNGEQGVCQDTSQSCAGRYQSGLCPGATSIRCCLPTSASAWGGCSYGGASGTCQDQLATDCHGIYRSGLCPGPTTVKCCLPAS